MDLTNIQTIKSLLQKYNLKPNKVMGQHFLISKNVLKKIIAAAELKKIDIVLEVGPGLGVLTQALAEHAGRIIAVEKDGALIPALDEIFSNHQNVELVQNDILKFDPAHYTLPVTNYKLVADLPYYLTSRFLRQFLESPTQPSLMVLLVQKEVAERICAKPPNATLLSNAVQYYANPKIVSVVQKNAFYPSPKIDSAILKLEIIRKYDSKFDKLFFKFLKIVFSAPRKQIFHNLTKKIPEVFFDAKKINRKSFIENCLNKAKIFKKQRPQEITIEQWIELSFILEGAPYS